jgi:hypothetical protein
MANKGQSAPRARLLRVDPGIGWRIRRFLGSRGHVVGALLGIVGILLLDAGLVHLPLAIPVIVGLYAIGYFLASRPQMTTDFGLQPNKESEKIEAGLDQMLATIRKQVAPDIYAKVVSIRDAAVYTLDHAENQQIDPDVYAVRQTVMTYLPEALTKYLSLPRAYAERQILENGKTSHQVMLEQLEAMDAKVHEVADLVIERDSQRLVAHGRFIADRFSDSNLEATDDPVATSLAKPASAAVPQQESQRQPEREAVRVV